ncbi:lactadherin-like [Amphiura filiformis]|uniref:lactadherin-like n=1 Tax=Amphiura filiformis TaxID=82378 RepID=UPI003B21B75A
MGFNCGASNARLNRPAQSGCGSWCSRYNNANQWIQADLGDSISVAGVQIQGRADYPQWVTQFKVQYSNDGSSWTFVQQTNSEGDMIFDGSTNQNTVVTNLFPAEVTAAYIRIVPTAWHGHISMRFELVGCEDDEMPTITGTPSAITTNTDSNSATAAVSWTDPTASDNSGAVTLTSDGTSGSNFPIGTTTVTFTATDPSGNQATDSFTITVTDLGETMSVTGVEIQGRADHYGQWVTQYKVQYSNDGSSWTYVQQTNNEADMIFVGNTDQHTVVTNLFPAEVTAAYIRIVPTAWSTHISMRFEVLGCEGIKDVVLATCNLWRRCCGSTYDLLPTPANLSVWYEDKTHYCCNDCGRKGTLQHILSACTPALADNRGNPAAS